jgi:hypothetical protein
MFNFTNFAVDGLMPGLFSKLSAGTLGAFDVEVIIEPVVQTGGGGYAVWTPKSGGKPDRYRVTVRIKFNGKTYTDSKIVDDIEARVIAKFNGITCFDENSTMVSVKGMQIFDAAEIKIRATLNITI